MTNVVTHSLNGLSRPVTCSWPGFVLPTYVVVQRCCCCCLRRRAARRLPGRTRPPPRPRTPQQPQPQPQAPVAVAPSPVGPRALPSRVLKHSFAVVPAQASERTRTADLSSSSSSLREKEKERVFLLRALVSPLLLPSDPGQAVCPSTSLPKPGPVSRIAHINSYYPVTMFSRNKLRRLLGLGIQDSEETTNTLKMNPCSTDVQCPSLCGMWVILNPTRCPRFIMSQCKCSFFCERACSVCSLHCVRLSKQHNASRLRKGRPLYIL